LRYVKKLGSIAAEMTEPQARKQVPILAALAQQTRLQILDRVSLAGPEGLAAGEIARALRCPASTLSFHLKELSRTGVLEARPEGRFIHYSLKRPALQALAGYIAALAGATRNGRNRRGAGARSQRRSRARAAGQLTFFGD
jgi:ArsR family transcriptional regulator, arsenate/arsenite/antimonite-responsive transcriptional repressor